MWLWDCFISLCRVVFLTVWGMLASVGRVFKKAAMHPDFSGDVCLITGAGRGLGRELAIQFADYGASVVLWDVNEENLKSTAERLRDKGHDVHYYVCDVSKRDEVRQTAEKVEEEVGHVTILINNAGVAGGKPFLQSSEDEIQQVMEVDMMAHFWTVKAFVPSMIEYGQGHIVSIASVSGFGGLWGMADYAAANGAVINFTEALRQELIAAGKDDITVTCICPYHMDTSMFKGYRTRFPRLLPAIKPSLVAYRTVRALMNKESVVITPEYMVFFVLIKWILPTKAYDELLNLIGANVAMKSASAPKKE